MPSVQLGFEPLVNGQTVYTFTFASAFTAPPAVVFPEVRNLNNTGSQPGLVALVTDITAADFKVTLSAAPANDDYELQYFAGDADAVIGAYSLARQFFHNQPALPGGVPNPNDRLVVINMNGAYPATQQTAWEHATGGFLKLVDVPGAANAAGTPGNFATDGNYLYFRTGTLWKRISFSPDTNWSVDETGKIKRSGSIQLTAAAVKQTLSFGTAFPMGNAPRVFGIVRNVLDTDPLILVGMIGASSITGFSLLLNAAPDSANYYFDYEAIQY